MQYGDRGYGPTIWQTPGHDQEREGCPYCPKKRIEEAAAENASVACGRWIPHDARSKGQIGWGMGQEDWLPASVRSGRN
jgi:hypothetical protein